jgi:hypothetical protein
LSCLGFQPNGEGVIYRPFGAVSVIPRGDSINPGQRGRNLDHFARRVARGFSSNTSSAFTTTSDSVGLLLVPCSSQPIAQAGFRLIGEVPKDAGQVPGAALLTSSAERAPSGGDNTFSEAHVVEVGRGELIRCNKPGESTPLLGGEDVAQ